MKIIIFRLGNFLFLFSILIGNMTWQDFYNKENDGAKTINEIVQSYNLYLFQNQTTYEVEYAMRKLGTNSMILQENSYAIIQEGEHEYGLLQET